jgi:hypothetical protein
MICPIEDRYNEHDSVASKPISDTNFCHDLGVVVVSCKYMGVWIDKWIHWTLTILNCNSLWHYCQFSQFLNIYALGILGLLSLISPLVPASNSGRCPSWVPQLPHATATATLDSQCTQLLNPSDTASSCHWLFPPFT